MFSRILVPLDGSAAAEAAISPAAVLARAHGAELHLVLVTELSRVDPTLDEQLEREHRTYRDERMQPVAKALRDDAGLAVTTVRLSGTLPVAAAVADYVAKTGSDLIVMATHGLTGWRRALAGSVADDLVHHTATPVLLLRLDDQSIVPPSPFRRILVALDGSKAAETALEPARALGRLGKSTLILGRVVTPVPVEVAAAQVPGVLVTDVGATKAQVDEANRYLDAVAAELRTRERLPVETVVDLAPVAFPSAPIGPMVARMARDVRADLVTLTTRDRRASRLLRSSVADRVLHDTHCALLVCHADGVDLHPVPEGAVIAQAAV